MRIAFVVNAFPVISERLILNQISGLLQMGHDVHLFAKRRGKMDKVQEDVAGFGLLERTRYLNALNMPTNRTLRVLKLFGLAAKGLPLAQGNPECSGPS